MTLPKAMVLIYIQMDPIMKESGSKITRRVKVKNAGNLERHM